MDDRNTPNMAYATARETRDPAAPIWLSVEQIRKRERCRRQKVIDAMKSGLLPFEQRGRIRYARLSDVVAWEESRLQAGSDPCMREIDPDLREFA